MLPPVDGFGCATDTAVFFGCVTGTAVVFGFAVVVGAGLAVVVVGAAVVVVVGSAVVVVVASAASCGEPNSPNCAAAAICEAMPPSAVRFAPREAVPSALRSAAANCGAAEPFGSVAVCAKNTAARIATLPTRAGTTRR